MPDWSDLQLLLDVARAGSATAAARRLGSSPSRLTRPIARLEETYGAALFRRERDGLRPTDAGQRLIDAARRMEAELNRLSLAPDDAVEGVVRLATTEGFAAMLVERGLCDLTRRHPGLRIELLAGNTPVDLAAGEADLALRTTEPTDAWVRVRRVATLALGLYRADAYRPGEPVTDPRGHDVVALGGELERLPEVVWLASAPDVRVVLRTSSYLAMYAAVRAGAGLGVLPRGWAALEPTLRLVGPVPVPERALWLATAPEAGGRAAVRAVRDAVDAILGGLER